MNHSKLLGINYELPMVSFHEPLQSTRHLERRLSVTNLSSENNFADVSTECSSRHQDESERSAKQHLLFIAMHY